MNASADRESSRSISSTMLGGVRDGRPQAWDRLVEVWAPLIYYWCRKSNLKPSDAEEAVQEVLLRVHQHVAGFQRTSFTAWVSAITHNVIVDRFRDGDAQPKAVGGSTANQRIQTLADPAGGAANEGSQDVPDPDTESLVVRRVLGVIREDFSERTFQAFWRTKVDGLPAAEVADELGMTAAAVRQAVRRVLRRLREELAGML